MLYGLGALFLIGFIGSIFEEKPSDVTQVAPIRAKLPATKTEFTRTRESVLANAERQLAAGDFAGVTSGLEQFRSTGDADVLRLLATAQEKEQLAELAKTPPEDLEHRIAIYSRLAKIAPGNSEYTTERDATRSKIAAQKKAAEERALANMKKTFDKIEGVTWYRDRASPGYNNAKAFYLYFGTQATGAPWLRMRIQYHADDWLFVERVIVVADEQRFTVERGNWETDNDSEIWEWLDLAPTDSELAMMRAVAAAKTVTIRFEGRQYRNDWILPNKHKAAIAHVLAAYEALGGR